MIGRLESHHFPYLPLRLEMRDETHAVEALIDSGFDGDVTVSPELLRGAEPDDYQRWTLADGSTVYASYVIGTVHVGDVGSAEAIITLLGDETLVGRGITDRYRVTLDHGVRVNVEP